MNNVLAWSFEDMVHESTQRIYKSIAKPLRLDIQFFAEGDPPPYSFGLADITVERDGVALEFNGKQFLQADGGELSLVPAYRELKFKDTGDTTVEHRLAGWAGTVTFVVGQEDLALMQLALSSVDEIVDTEVPANVVGLTDSKMGTALRGYKVTIHPRVLPANDKRFDYTIYQMASTGGITKPYNDEQTMTTITLNMLPRVGFDASQPGNFFYTGPTDPNAAPVTP